MAEKKYRIHPAIGIARVGDADRQGGDFFFIGPETQGVPANYDTKTGQFHAFKKGGRIKPQAARFRIFEYEKGPDGRFSPKQEVKLGDGRTRSIAWRVHVANRKASFCEFAGQQGAEDTPLFSSYDNKKLFVRNRTVKGLQTRISQLELDPREREINGGSTVPVELSFNRAGISLTTLGQLRSDAQGRLIFIGGTGRADHDKSLPGHPNGNGQLQPSGSFFDYANNDSWFDDISDGSIEATIVVDDNPHPQEVEGAWVLVAPPKFAPPLKSYRTMYDTLVDLIVREIPIPDDDGLFAGPLADIASMKKAWKSSGNLSGFQPSFTRHIYPILSAAAGVPRVHEPIVAKSFHTTLAPDGYDILGGPDSESKDRGDIFQKIRDPKFSTPPNPALMPATLGDYYDRANRRGGSGDPAFLHAVSQVQFELLKAWKKGKFVKDWNGPPTIPAVITPEGLDRAALENAIGGAFFPGIEASWLFAKAAVFRAPFRIAKGQPVGSAPVPGQTKRRDIILEAGAFSQQMALPWHADFFDCSTELHMSRRLAWWPFQRPDDVYPLDSPKQQKLWARKTDDSPFRGFSDMVDGWSGLGFVVRTNDDLFEVERSAPLVG